MLLWVILAVEFVVRWAEGGGKCDHQHITIILYSRALFLANNLHLMDGTSTSEIIGGDVFFEIVEPNELYYTYRLRPAKDFGAPFSDRFKFEEIPLVLTEPDLACSDIENWEDLRGNVALVERGQCSFVSKAINVEKAGAVAIIITDSESNGTDEGGDEDFYIEMVHDNSERETKIPAGYLLGKNGRLIRRTLNRLQQNYAIINIPVNLTFTPPHEILRFG